MRRRIWTGGVLGFVLCLLLATVASANAGSMTVFSDTTVDVCGPLSEYAPPGDEAWDTCDKAVATWVHPSWPSIPGATWISTSYLIGQDGSPVADSSWRWFRKTFELCPGAYNTKASAVLATSDNAEDVYLNGVPVGSDGEVQDPYEDNFEWATLIQYDITPVPGVNTLDFIVRNYPGSSDPKNNPTGLIFKAEIFYECPPDYREYWGFTPGFWKNHTADAPSGHDAWKYTEYTPTMTLESVFGTPPECVDGDLGSKTLLDALKFKGGRGEEGASRILLRAGVAALLNASFSENMVPDPAPGGPYPYTVDEVIGEVNAALASCDRFTMITLAKELDDFNNNGTEDIDWNWPAP